MPARLECDLLIIGSGFAGSILGMTCARRGLRVAIIDKARHPRFAIGESTTPMTNLLLEHLAKTYDLPELIGFTEWGRWQREYPDVPVGLKRGFTFLQHSEGAPYRNDRATQLLVAASPNDEVADTHWFRAAFDERLAQLAVARGVQLFNGSTITSVSVEPEAVVHFDHEDQSHEIKAKFIVDASGPRGCLFQHLKLTEKTLPHLPHASALYSHFCDVAPLDEAAFDTGAPYPPEDAAVHHLFPGGWIWVLRFNNGITSAGISAQADFTARFNLPRGEPAWREILGRFPTLEKQFSRAKAIQPFFHQPTISFCSSQMVGERWAMLPSAAAFIDPLLSTGFPLTLLGIQRLATAFTRNVPPWPGALLKYSDDCNRDLETGTLLVATLLKNLANFPVFQQVSLLYFASSIWAETEARRGNVEWLEGFPLAHKTFAASARAILLNAQTYPETIRSLLAPYDLADLTNPANQNWHHFPA